MFSVLNSALLYILYSLALSISCSFATKKFIMFIFQLFSFFVPTFQGLYPESHGIVSNIFYDSKLKDTFLYYDVSSFSQSKWWGGEPVSEPTWQMARENKWTHGWGWKREREREKRRGIFLGERTSMWVDVTNT